MAHTDGDSVARVKDDTSLGYERAIGVVLTEVRRKRQGNLGRIDKVLDRALERHRRRLDRANNRLVVLHRVDGEGTFHDEHAKKWMKIW